MMQFSSTQTDSVNSNKRIFIICNAWCNQIKQIMHVIAYQQNGIIKSREWKRLNSKSVKRWISRGISSHPSANSLSFLKIPEESNVCVHAQFTPLFCSWLKLLIHSSILSRGREYSPVQSHFHRCSVEVFLSIAEAGISTDN